MASHVVVIDSTARRATVKTQPGTYLSDVRDEACKKLKLSPEQYSLKHNKKPVDLTRTFRLSGLPSGAQLDLVQASKSATVVNVALQLPATEDNRRLTDKFPSTTSLWQILRQFESKNSLNFTQRGTPHTENGGVRAGRLFYEMPSVDALGRQMASFVDLQKTLSQLGITSGSALLRLSFRSSGQPLEEAMTDMSQYFKEVDEPSASSTHENPIGQSQPDLEAGRLSEPGIATTVEERAEPERVKEDAQSTTNGAPRPVSSTGRSVQVFYAPTSSTPSAAALPHNEEDYVPGIEHAQRHQARLNQEGRNKRLLSDSEIAAREQEKEATLSKVNTVKTRIRLPDQDTIVIDFLRDDTGADVYTEVRSRMENPAAAFRLMYYNDKAQHVLLDDGPKKLIPQLGWRGSMQINMLWDENVPATIRDQPCLSAKWRSQRQHAQPVRQPVGQGADENAAVGADKGTGRHVGGKVASIEDKLKWFLGVGKKK